MPTTCKGFSVTGATTETCASTLTEGYTYVIYTKCETVKGSPVLYLLDDNGVEVAFNGALPAGPVPTLFSRLRRRLRLLPGRLLGCSGRVLQCASANTSHCWPF